MGERGAGLTEGYPREPYVTERDHAVLIKALSALGLICLWLLVELQ